MKNTYQYKNHLMIVDMIKHGQMVNEEYCKLLKLLKHNHSNHILAHLTPENIQWLLGNQYDSILMRHYHMYHDCGKPFCLKAIDGKNHYPNHAKVSKEIHEQYFDMPVASQLIEFDMNFHNLKSEALDNWLNENKLNNKLLASLYLTAWAELLANSMLFGGEKTDSFKIKKKQLIKAGKKLFNLYKADNLMNDKELMV